MQQRLWRAVWRVARLGLVVLSALLTALAAAVLDVAAALMRVARYGKVRERVYLVYGAR
jgi:hypothetical protein